MRILVANRGEIAVRIFSAIHELGGHSLAIFSEADSYSLHRFKAHESIPLFTGEKSMKDVNSYLDKNKIVSLAKQHDVDLIHPGENLKIFLKMILKF